MNIIKQLFTNILDIMFPRQCVGCGIYDQWACQRCIQQHLSVEYREADANDKQQTPMTVLTLGLYSNPFWRQCVGLLKFHKVREVSEVLAVELANAIWKKQHLLLDVKNIVIIPIPLHKKRLNERGFNQAELIAHALGEVTGWPVLTDLLIRTKHTPSQTTVSHSERVGNIQGVFSINNKNDLLNGVQIVLIDDVITTGATTLEAVRILNTVQPAGIHALAIARGHD